MKYTCVKAETKKTRGGREYAILWFKVDPNNQWERPERHVSFSKQVIEYVKEGLAEGSEQEAEIVTYPLGRKFKYPNGVVTDRLRLFCSKVHVDGHWEWMRGYSPDELAMNTLHVLTPV